MEADKTKSDISGYMTELAQQSGHKKAAAMPEHTFGQMIKFARKDQGMSRPELAEIVGVSVNSIAKYERAGLSSGQFPPIPKLAKIIAATKIDARSLMATASDDWQEQKAILGGALEPLGEVMEKTNSLMEEVTPHAGEIKEMLSTAFAELMEDDGPFKDLMQQMASDTENEIAERIKNSEDDLPSPPSSQDDQL